MSMWTQEGLGDRAIKTRVFDQVPARDRQVDWTLSSRYPPLDGHHLYEQEIVVVTGSGAWACVTEALVFQNGIIISF
jgi:hypothetical protein